MDIVSPMDTPMKFNMKHEVSNRYLPANIREEVAQLAHEANRFYCKKIGDNTQEEWANAPEWQKESARNGVEFVYNNPDAGFDAQHENWLKQKAADGWVYGANKNEKRKTHPCFVRYGDLPSKEKIKDMIFLSAVKAMLKMKGVT